MKQNGHTQLLTSALTIFVIFLANNPYNPPLVSSVATDTPDCLSEKGVSDIAISTDGKLVAAAVGSPMLPLWNLYTGARDSTFSYSKAQYGFYRVALSPNRKYVAASTGREVVLWDRETDKLLHVFQSSFEEIDTGVKIFFTPDSRYILTANTLEGVLWDIASGTRKYTFPTHSNNEISADLSPDGKYVLTSGDDATVLWDTGNGQSVHRFEFGIWSESSFSPDGQHIFINIGGHATLWDANTYRQVRAFEMPGLFNWKFSSDGRYLLTKHENPHEGAQYIVWDTRTGKKLYTFTFVEPVHPGFAAFLPHNENLLISSDELSDLGHPPHADFTVYKVWSLKLGRTIQKVTVKSGGFYALAVVPSNENLIGATNDGLFTWNLATFQVIQSFC